MKCLTCPAEAGDSLFCGACEKILYPDWEILFYQPVDPVTKRPLKKKGPDRSDYIPLRKVNGKWVQVRHRP
jgi:hypothetical protein